MGSSDDEEQGDYPVQLMRELSGATLAGDLAEKKAREAIEARLFKRPGTPIGLGRFEVGGQLGNGAMGRVYVAYDPKLDRSVAIKELKRRAWASSEQSRLRMLQEARAMAKISHPNVVTVHEVLDEGEHLAIVMEYVEGQTLTAWLQERDRELQQIVPMFIAAGEGLAAAHQHGFVHRDFKPDNVLIRQKDGHVFVTDFGLVSTTGTTLLSEGPLASSQEIKEIDISLASAGAVRGTPAYMAPEQHDGGKVEQSADQFSFCVTLYEAIYGERPFRGNTYRELLENVKSGKIVSPSNPSRGSKALFAIVTRGLSVAPAQRYVDMKELLRELRAVSLDTRRRFLVWMLSGILMLLLALTLLGFTHVTNAAIPGQDSAVRENLIHTGEEISEKILHNLEQSVADLEILSRRIAAHDQIESLPQDVQVREVLKHKRPVTAFESYEECADRDPARHTCMLSLYRDIVVWRRDTSGHYERRAIHADSIGVWEARAAPRYVLDAFEPGNHDRVVISEVDGRWISIADSGLEKPPTQSVKNFRGVFHFARYTNELVVVLSLDHAHIAQPTKVIVASDGSLLPTGPMTSREWLQHYTRGDYVYLLDNRTWMLSHPKPWHIHGRTADGSWPDSISITKPKSTADKEHGEGDYPLNICIARDIPKMNAYYVAALTARRKAEVTFADGKNLWDIPRQVALTPILLERKVSWSYFDGLACQVGPTTDRMFGVVVVGRKTARMRENGYLEFILSFMGILCLFRALAYKREQRKVQRS